RARRNRRARDRRGGRRRALLTPSAASAAAHRDRRRDRQHHPLPPTESEHRSSSERSPLVRAEPPKNQRNQLRRRRSKRSPTALTPLPAPATPPDGEAALPRILWSRHVVSMRKSRYFAKHVARLDTMLCVVARETRAKPCGFRSAPLPEMGSHK